MLCIKNGTVKTMTGEQWEKGCVLIGDDGKIVAVGADVEIPAEAIHGRAEEMGRKPEYREQYDLSTARAVSDLRELSEYCLPFVKKGGYFCALKGPDTDEEIKGASKAIALLGGKVMKVNKYTLSDGSKRSIVCIKKISHTNPKYPRPSAKIAKNPLV